jgi:ATP-dependent Clp protease ATP-binding subunit ClpA
MTSNIGAPFIMEQSKNMDETNREPLYIQIKNHVENLLKQNLRPEFLNRIDEIVVFHPLIQTEIKQIVDLQIDLLKKRLEKKGFTLSMGEEAKVFLAQTGYDPAFGARPIKRSLQKLVADPLASRILKREFIEGDHIEVVFKENRLDFLRKSL